MGLAARKLRTTKPAAGGAFSPDDISGLALWFDADDATTITESAGEVTSWANKVPAGVGFAPTASGPQTGLTTIGGLNALDFNGTTESLSLGGSGTIVSQPLTVFLVAEIDTKVTNEHLTDLGSANRVLISGDGNWRAYAGSAVIGDTVASDLDPHVIVFVVNGASSAMRVDGGSVGSGNPGTNAITDSWRLMESDGSVYTDGRIGEVLVYDSALSGTDLSDVETYLATKWGTP